MVEGSKTRIAMHGNDPPLYQYLGSPQILCRFADFDRLFAEVPSKHNGITFCVGTRYESGEDVFAGIRHFGSQGKLFHVHFRNVRGTLPAGGITRRSSWTTATSTWPRWSAPSTRSATTASSTTTTPSR